MEKNVVKMDWLAAVKRPVAKKTEKPLISKRIKTRNKEETFVLVTPSIVLNGFMGLFVKDVEKKGLTIIGIKLMNVSLKFAKCHLSKPGRIPFKPGFPEDVKFWVHQLTGGRNVAMLLEGENAVSIAYNCSLEQRTHFLEPFKTEGGVYYSASIEHATEDAEFWFPDGHDKFSEDCFDKDLTFVFRKNKLRGNLRDGYIRGIKFFLLIPIAVRERLVGELLCALDCSSRSFKGIKLVDMNDDLRAIISQSADSSSSSCTVKDDDDISFGVAVVCDNARPHHIVLTRNGDNRAFHDHEHRIFKVDKNLLYIAEEGENTWELVEKCFHFGFVFEPKMGRADLLEASLVGL